MGLGLGQRLDFIFKKGNFGAKSPLTSKILFISQERALAKSKSSANLCYEWSLGTNPTPLYGQRALAQTSVERATFKEGDYCERGLCGQRTLPARLYRSTEIE